MAQDYLEFIFEVTPSEPGCEILIAELGEAGFESFVESERGVTAYIQQEEWRDSIFKDIRILKSSEFKISYTSTVIKQLNWNEAWEKNFNPIEVSENCVVRAPFHKSYDVPYEIIIEPKMSFGTGHHETTYLMMRHLLENDLKSKTVLDMGCGTAVLAILAEMRGANKVDAIDIDEWCVENSAENIQRNSCTAISVALGDASSLTDIEKYDVIIANINRNILLNDIPVYAKNLRTSGTLYLSGFYHEDLPMITSACNKEGLNFVEHKQKNNWIAAKFVN